MNHLKLLFFILVVMLLSRLASAQHHTFLSIQGAFCRDLYRIEDNGNFLVTVPLNTGLWGISILQEINSRAFAEIGVISKSYWEGFGFRNIRVYGTSDAFNAVMVSLKFGYRLKLVRQFSLVPAVGIAVGINTSPEVASGGGSGKIVSNGNTIEYDFDENDDVARTFFMAHPSIAIEGTLLGTLVLAIYASRPIGFNKANQLDISYTINSSSPITAKAVNRGDYWSAGLALRFPVSNLWRKR